MLERRNTNTERQMPTMRGKKRHFKRQNIHSYITPNHAKMGTSTTAWQP